MKLQRLIAILTILLQKERASASWFAEKFGVSVRTIYRDIGVLEAAGIPIVTHTGINGGISIVEQYKIDKKLFTNQDISTLLTSLNSFSGSLSDAKTNLTIEKIKSLIPKEYGKSIEISSKQLYIDMSPWSNNPAVTKALQVIQKSLDENRLLSFDYFSRYGNSSQRIVEPHQLVLKENNWYLRGFCTEKQDFRIFKLSRIKKPTKLAQQFEPREFESEMTDFKDWQNEKMITVTIIVSPSLRERALDFCREEYMQDLDNGKIMIKMPFVESDMAYGLLLGMGKNCKVISPEHVKEEMIRRIEEIRLVYENDTQINEDLG